MDYTDLPGKWGELATIITLITVFLVILVKLLEQLEKIQKYIPTSWFRAFYILVSLIVPNGIMVTYFFYLAGLEPERLSEYNFYYGLIIQLVILLSLYTFAWGRWFHPRLLVANLKKNEIEEKEIDKKDDPAKNAEKGDDE